MAAMMQVNASTLVALPAVTGISFGSLNSGSIAKVNSNRRLAMHSLVAARAECNLASGGTTDKAGYTQTNVGGLGAPNPGTFANDVVEGVVDKAEDAQRGAANLGFETQQNLKNVETEFKDGVGELVDDTKNIIDKATSKNPRNEN